MLVYRIQPPIYAADCLSGTGARLVGGRWNPVGTPLVYAATTPELALLETLVHLDGTPVAKQPPKVLVTISVPEDMLLPVPLIDLPAGWNQVPAPLATETFLSGWLGPAYPVMGWLVPSVVMPASPSRCVLLNPLHRQAASMQIELIEPLELDPRLRPPAPVRKRRAK